MAAKDPGKKKKSSARRDPRDPRARQPLSVPLDDLPPNRDQPRHHRSAETLKDLADSIDRHDLLHPVLVRRRRDKGYRLVAGERRADACRLLGWSEIPAFLVEGDPAEIALIENLQREALHPLDEAKAYSRLKDTHGYTQVQLAKAVGKSQTAISRSLKLLTLPEDIQDSYYATSHISKSVAEQIVSNKDPNDLREAWEAATSAGMTVAEARAQKPPGRARPPASPADHALRKANALLAALDDVSSKDPKLPEIVDMVKRIHTLVCG